MKTRLWTETTVAEIVEGFTYNELEEKGLFGLSGRLIIQPEYQRNYIYSSDGGKKEIAVPSNQEAAFLPPSLTQKRPLLPVVCKHRSLWICVSRETLCARVPASAGLKILAIILHFSLDIWLVCGIIIV